MGSDSNEHAADSAHVLSRRRLLKATAATAAGAAVWVEPTIKGLARRPAYAAAGSSVTGDLQPGFYGVDDFNYPDGPFYEEFFSFDGDVVFALASDTSRNLYFLYAFGNDCTCTFDDLGDGDVLLSNGSVTSVGFLDLEIGDIFIGWDPTDDPPTELTISAPIPYTCIPN